MAEVEVCENCGVTIGKFERAYVHNGKVVCHDCWYRLTSSQQPLAQTAQAGQALTAATLPNTFQAASMDKTDESERELITCRPSMFASDPVRYIVCILGIPFFGIGLACLLVWRLSNRRIKLTVTNRRVIYEKGILSKKYTEIWLDDIKTVRLEQTFFERLLGCGTVILDSAGSTGAEIVMRGLRGAKRVVEMIQQNRQKARM